MHNFTYLIGTPQLSIKFPKGVMNFMYYGHSCEIGLEYNVNILGYDSVQSIEMWAHFTQSSVDYTSDPDYFFINLNFGPLANRLEY